MDYIPTLGSQLLLYFFLFFLLYLHLFLILIETDFHMWYDEVNRKQLLNAIFGWI